MRLEAVGGNSCLSIRSFIVLLGKKQIHEVKSGNDEIGSGCWQFLFDYKVVHSALENLLASRGEIFIVFSIKRGVRKLPQSFFFVKVGPPNDQSAAFVGRFDNYIFALTKILKCRSLFRRKVGKFGVTIEITFIDVMTAFIEEKI